MQAASLQRSVDYVPLCVPPWEQREAFAAGAQYTESLGFHVAADALLDPVWTWLPRMFNPQAKRPVLAPEMLPVTTWEQNIRHIHGADVWDRMRKHAYRAAGFRCEICGARGRLEAHELWALINETGVQKLERLLALCALCHKAHHLGIAKRLGLFNDVLEHLMWVNGWSTLELGAALTESREAWEQRCEWPWVVNLSWLDESGYFHV